MQFNELPSQEEPQALVLGDGSIIDPSTGRVIGHMTEEMKQHARPIQIQSEGAVDPDFAARGIVGDKPVGMPKSMGGPNRGMSWDEASKRRGATENYRKIWELPVDDKELDQSWPAYERAMKLINAKASYESKTGAPGYWKGTEKDPEYVQSEIDKLDPYERALTMHMASSIEHLRQRERVGHKDLGKLLNDKYFPARLAREFEFKMGEFQQTRRMADEEIASRTMLGEQAQYAGSSGVTPVEAMAKQRFGRALGDVDNTNVGHDVSWNAGLGLRGVGGAMQQFNNMYAGAGLIGPEQALTARKEIEDQFKGNPDTKGNFFLDTLPSAAGSMVPMALASMLPGGIGSAAGFAAATYGGAGDEKLNALEAGASPDVVEDARNFGGALGATEMIPLLGAQSKVAKAALKLSDRAQRRAALGAVKRSVVMRGAGEEFLQEAGSSLLSDVGARNTYDPDRGVSAGRALESGAAGLILGGPMAAIGVGNETRNIEAEWRRKDYAKSQEIKARTEKAFRDMKAASATPQEKGVAALKAKFPKAADEVLASVNARLEEAAAKGVKIDDKTLLMSVAKEQARYDKQKQIEADAMARLGAQPVADVQEIPATATPPAWPGSAPKPAAPAAKPVAAPVAAQPATTTPIAAPSPSQPAPQQATVASSVATQPAVAPTPATQAVQPQPAPAAVAPATQPTQIPVETQSQELVELGQDEFVPDGTILSYEGQDVKAVGNHTGVTQTIEVSLPDGTTEYKRRTDLKVKPGAIPTQPAPAAAPPKGKKSMPHLEAARKAREAKAKSEAEAAAGTQPDKPDTIAGRAEKRSAKAARDHEALTALKAAHGITDDSIDVFENWESADIDPELKDTLKLANAIANSKKDSSTNLIVVKGLSGKGVNGFYDGNGNIFVDISPRGGLDVVETLRGVLYHEMVRAKWDGIESLLSDADKSYVNDVWVKAYIDTVNQSGMSDKAKSEYLKRLESDPDLRLRSGVAHMINHASRSSEAFDDVSSTFGGVKTGDAEGLESGPEGVLIAYLNKANGKPVLNADGSIKLVDIKSMNPNELNKLVQSGRAGPVEKKHRSYSLFMKLAKVVKDFWDKLVDRINSKSGTKLQVKEMKRKIFGHLLRAVEDSETDLDPDNTMAGRGKKRTRATAVKNFDGLVNSKSENPLDQAAANESGDGATQREIQPEDKKTLGDVMASLSDSERAMAVAIGDKMAKGRKLTVEEQALLMKIKGAFSPAISEEGRDFVKDSEVKKVLYHGTRAQPAFEEFKTMNEARELGIHMAEDPVVTEFFSHGFSEDDRGHVYPVLLRSKKLLRLKDVGSWRFEHVAKQLEEEHGIKVPQGLWDVFRKNELGPQANRELKQWLKKTYGYDGIVYLNRHESNKEGKPFNIRGFDSATTDENFKSRHPYASDSYIAFWPEQIKSVNNKGTYDQSTRNIGYSPAPQGDSASPVVGTNVRSWFSRNNLIPHGTELENLKSILDNGIRTSHFGDQGFDEGYIIAYDKGSMNAMEKSYRPGEFIGRAKKPVALLYNTGFYVDTQKSEDLEKDFLVAYNKHIGKADTIDDVDYEKMYNTTVYGKDGLDHIVTQKAHKWQDRALAEMDYEKEHGKPMPVSNDATRFSELKEVGKKHGLPVYAVAFKETENDDVLVFAKDPSINQSGYSPAPQDEGPSETPGQAFKKRYGDIPAGTVTPENIDRAMKDRNVGRHSDPSRQLALPPVTLEDIEKQTDRAYSEAAYRLIDEYNQSQGLPTFKDRAYTEAKATVYVNDNPQAMADRVASILKNGITRENAPIGAEEVAALRIYATNKLTEGISADRNNMDRWTAIANAISAHRVAGSSKGSELKALDPVISNGNPLAAQSVKNVVMTMPESMQAVVDAAATVLTNEKATEEQKQEAAKTIEDTNKAWGQNMKEMFDEIEEKTGVYVPDLKDDSIPEDTEGQSGDITGSTGSGSRGPGKGPGKGPGRGGGGAVSTEDAIRIIAVSDTYHATWGDKVHEYYLAALQSMPTTFAANWSGNFANTVLEYLIVKPTEAMIGAVTGSKNLTGFGDLMTAYKAFYRSFKAALRVGLMSFRTGKPVFEMETAGSEGTDVERENQTIRLAIGGKAGKIIRTPLAANMAVDQFYRQLIFGMEVEMHAHRIAKNKGLTDPKAIQKEMAMQIADKNSEAYRVAIGEAERITFAKELGGFMKKIKESRNYLAKSARGLDPFTGAMTKSGKFFQGLGNLANALGRAPADVSKYIPFIVSPINLMATGLRYTPLSLPKTVLSYLKALKHRKSTDAPSHIRDAAKRTAHQVIGMIAMYLIAGIEDDKDGLPSITGSDPFTLGGTSETDRKRRTVPEQSIRIPGTDVWLSYARIDPIATMLSTTVDTVNAMKTAKKHGKSRAADELMTKMLGMAKNKSFFEGVSRFTDAMTGTERFGDFYSRWIAAWSPNLIRGGLTAMDDRYRFDRIPANDPEYWSKLVDQTMRRIAPFPGQTYPKVDVWGRDSMKGRETFGFRFMIPIDIKQRKDIHDTDVWLNRYYKENPDAPRIGAVDREKLSGKDYYALSKLSGETASHWVSRLKFRPNVSDDLRFEVIKKTIAKSREFAKSKLKLKTKDRG